MFKTSTPLLRTVLFKRVNNHELLIVETHQRYCISFIYRTTAEFTCSWKTLKRIFFNKVKLDKNTHIGNKQRKKAEF